MSPRRGIAFHARAIATPQVPLAQLIPIDPEVQRVAHGPRAPFVVAEGVQEDDANLLVVPER
eukprot:7930046-Pyramimonas_sp.AAC.1